MIISGEKEGPLEPTPKNVGILIAGFNPLILDTVVATIMGFDFKRIPQIYQAYKIKKYPISKFRYEDIKIISNNKLWARKVNDIKLEDTLKYITHPGWEGHIEME